MKRPSKLRLFLLMLLLSTGLLSGFSSVGFTAQAAPPYQQEPDGVTVTPTPTERVRIVIPGIRRGGDDAATPAEPATPPTATPIPLENAIQNGGFERPGPRDVGVAPPWQRYDNGGAYFGWYDEQWMEAVYSGKHSQLLEIEYVPEKPDRVIGIYQTVDVYPNSEYLLTFQALMRSDVLPGDLREDNFSMAWGIDYTGRGDYNAVELGGSGWQELELAEQAYIGSNQAEHLNPQPLTFERIKVRILTHDSRRLTLFIRGIKHIPSTRELNFNIDEVSLIGPLPQPSDAPAIPASVEQPQPQDDVVEPEIPGVSPAAADAAPPTAIPASTGNSLPDAGGVPAADDSPMPLMLAGSTLILLLMAGLWPLLKEEE